VQPILEKFEQRRLLVTRMEKGEQRTVEVAHEALFRSWAPLRALLDNHRAELLLVAQLRRDARAWGENNCAAENLWHGGRLQQAAELMRRGELGVGGKDRDPELRFVQMGIRRRRIKRGMLLGITILVIAVLSVLLILTRAAQLKAEASERQARQLNYVANMNLANQAQTDDDQARVS